MWACANQGVPLQGGEEAAGLLDRSGLQVQFPEIIDLKLDVKSRLQVQFPEFT